MKKIILIISIMTLLIPNVIYALKTSDANTSIDINKEGSINLNYLYNDYELNDINVQIYHVASITEDFIYQSSKDFSSYPIKINSLSDDNEWKSLIETLNTYINIDGIKETYSCIIKDNNVKVSNLKPGLYLVNTEKVNKKNYSLVFDSALINVPGLEKNGDWNYDVIVYPKVYEYTEKNEDVIYKVTKEWNDNEDNRPESIKIEIYHDGNFVDTQILSSSNNWTYEWKANNNSNWNVIERNVPEGYNVLISKEDNNFIILNTEINYEEENPKTLDDINLYLYLFYSSLIGLILLLVSLFIKKIIR